MASGASRRTSAGRVRADHDRVSHGGSRGADHAAGHGHVERRAAGCVDTDRRVRPQPGCRDGDPQLAHGRRDARCVAASPASQKATVGQTALAYPGCAPCASCADHRGDRRRRAGVRRRCWRSDRAGSTSWRFTPPMAICSTSSSRRCRIRAPTGTGVISPGGPSYPVPFARSVPGRRSQDRRAGDAGWAASG